MIIDIGLKLLSHFFRIYNLGEGICLLRNKVLQKTVIEIFFLFGQFFMPLIRIEGFRAFVEFNIFPDLFEKLKYFVSTL
jgi:hypothetical protein